MDKIDKELLEAIGEECERSREGAFTGILLKYCVNDMAHLLKRLDALERKEGLITIGKPKYSKGRDTYGKLIAAGNISLTDKGMKTLSPFFNKVFNLQEFSQADWKWLIGIVIGLVSVLLGLAALL